MLETRTSDVTSESTTKAQSELNKRVSTSTADRWFAAETVGCRVPQSFLSGRVAAIFDKACIVEMTGADFVAILSSDVGNVAHGVRVGDYGQLCRYLRTWVSATLDGNALVFGDDKAAVTFVTAQVWRSEFRLGMTKPNFCAVDEDYRLRYLLGQHGATCGSEFLSVALSLGSRATHLTAWLAVVLPHLALATQKRDPDAALTSLQQVIGVGPGLTPSGDDFIIGWLAGLVLTAQSREELGFVRTMAAGINSMSEGTTPLSAQHIADACAFEFSERLSDLCMALCQHAPLPVLGSRLVAQLAVGATSGADAAAGLAFALRNRADEASAGAGRRR